MSSRASAMRTPECRRISTIAHSQKAASSACVTFDVLATLQIEDADVRQSSEPDAAFIHPAPEALMGVTLQRDGLPAGHVRGLRE
ncbi:hypothetical protein [Streptomyces sp. NPDC056682]|uniref:hypothetical protein n=1 Tax=Streptomyces sp. NPDC056682 TaxID=3345909 RepID=UPI0036A7E821